MKKGTIIIIAVAVVLVLTAGIRFFVLRGNDEVADTLENIKTINVTRGDIQLFASGSAVIQSGDKKNITAISSGRVKEILVSEGQEVVEGNLLMTFEDTSTNSEIERILLEIEQQQAELQDIYENRSDLKIYAPVSGYIGKISAEVGNDLNSGYKITTITNSESMIVYGYYTKNEFDIINVGDRANVTVDEYMNTFKGTVVDKNQTPLSRSGGKIVYAISVVLDNPESVVEGDVGRVSVVKNNGDLRTYETSAFTYSDNREVVVKTAGEVAAVHVNDGQMVKAGQLIMTLESSNIDRQITSQQNSIERTNSELEEKLQALEDSAIYSPISGVVTGVKVSVGEQVGTNSILLTIADLRNLEIVIPVDELEINKIEVGMPAKVTVDAVSGKVFSASVTNIALEGNYTNGVSTFDVTLQLASSEGLKPGMSGDGIIVLDKSTGTLLLPIEAVQTNREGSFVMKASSAEGELSPIKIGLVSEYYVEILEGVSEGEEIKYLSTSSTTPTIAPGTGIPGMGGGIPGMGGGQKSGSTSGGGN